MNTNASAMTEVTPSRHALRRLDDSELAAVAGGSKDAWVGARASAQGSVTPSKEPGWGAAVVVGLIVLLGM